MITDLWSIWWVWIVAALVLAIIEIFVPAFVFLGLAVGAAVVGVALGFGALGFVGASPAILLFLFAAVSLGAVIGLRAVLGVRRGQVKTWDTDIND
ncbi:MAG: hypothetical protein AAFY49_09545 [Pseudomonadota bacterium]